MIRKGTVLDRTIDSLKVIAELKGVRRFTTKEVHEYSGGNYATVSAYLRNISRTGVITMDGKDIYRCPERAELDNIDRAFVSRPPAIRKENNGKDESQIKRRAPRFKKVPCADPEISLEEAKESMMWLFDEYIPHLQGLVRDLSSFVEQFGKKAREAKIIHQERLIE